MVALTGKDRLPTVMLTKDKASLKDLSMYTDPYGLSATLTDFTYTAGLPGAAANSFIASLSVINPTQHFEQAVLPVFRNLFASHTKTSNLDV